MSGCRGAGLRPRPQIPVPKRWLRRLKPVAEGESGGPPAQRHRLPRGCGLFDWIAHELVAICAEVRDGGPGSPILTRPLFVRGPLPSRVLQVDRVSIRLFSEPEGKKYLAQRACRGRSMNDCTFRESQVWPICFRRGNLLPPNPLEDMMIEIHPGAKSKDLRVEALSF